MGYTARVPLVPLEGREGQSQVRARRAPRLLVYNKRYFKCNNKIMIDF